LAFTIAPEVLRDRSENPARASARHAPVHAVLSSLATRRPPSRLGLLSWGSSKIAPPPTKDTSRPLPAEQAQLSAMRCQPHRMVRPCRFSRLRRFTPRDAAQVCCTLQPAMGFAMFPARKPFPMAPTLRSFSLPGSISSVNPGTAPIRRQERRPGATAETALTPLSPVISVGSARTRSQQDMARDSTSGLCSTEESVASQWCCHRWRARCSLGLVAPTLPDLWVRTAWSTTGPEGPAAFQLHWHRSVAPEGARFPVPPPQFPKKQLRRARGEVADPASEETELATASASKDATTDAVV
jgi:hypothetical protein